MSALDPRTPMLVGLGVAMQREEDPTRAKDALGLMLDAVDRAGADCGVPALLGAVQQVAVPKGRWSYADPAGAIVRHVGARGAMTIASTVGVLQQTLIGRACRDIADGTVETALVAGGDAGYRILRAQITGAALVDGEAEGTPDLLLAPAAELRHPAELRAGLRDPVGLYAMIESAWRARHGWSIAAHRDRLARLYSRFSEIAAANPHAWRREALDAATIRDASPRNPLQAFPYNRLHCSSWNVDQAAALLFCSAAKAQAMGVPRDRWIFPLASSESNVMVPLSERRVLDACPGAGVAGRAALAAAGRAIEAIDLVELYSCFPAAVEIYAAELRIADGTDLTVTGGMPFAGGPYNNYVLQATCRMAELLRERPGETGLVASVSGVLTKQGFGIWCSEPNPSGYRWDDVTAQVAAAAERKPVDEDYAGPARIAGFTVVQVRGQPPRTVIIADTPGDTRVVAVSEDAGTAARGQGEELCGAAVTVSNARFSL